MTLNLIAPTYCEPAAVADRGKPEIGKMFEVVCQVANEEGEPGLYGRVYARIDNMSARGALPYYETAEGAVAAAWLLNLQAYKAGDDLVEHYGRKVGTRERVSLYTLGRTKPVADDDLSF